MKWLIKITAIFYICIYIYFVLSPFNALSVLKSDSFSISSQETFIALEQNDRNSTAVNLNKINDSHLKSIPVVRIGIKPMVKSFNFRHFEKYIRYNELEYNHPLICFKFPLSEHTKAG